MQLLKPQLAQALDDARQQLIELIEDATDSQLASPSLCAGWTNRNVLAHIIAFELDSSDIWQLITSRRSLDEITDRQSKRYDDLTAAQYIQLLQRGHRRIQFLLRYTPAPLLGIKFIRVPRGHLSLGQLFGDLLVDRTVHYFDIAVPLGVPPRVTNATVMSGCLNLMLSCLGLLNPSIPTSFYGQLMELKLTGISPRTCYWEIGTDHLYSAPGNRIVALSAMVDTNDLLFRVAARGTNVKNEPITSGNQELAKIILKSFNANALWEGL